MTIYSEHSGHDTNFCMFNNELHHLEEERVSRIKHGNPPINLGKLLNTGNWDVKGWPINDIVNIGKTKQKALKRINLNLSDNIKYNNDYFLFHHTAHAAYTYYTRPDYMEDTDILSYDGWGSYTDRMFFHNEKLIDDSIFGIGMLWNRLSLFIFGGDQYAGKLMGWSAYGKMNIGLYEIFIEFIKTMKSMDNVSNDGFINIKYNKDDTILNASNIIIGYIENKSISYEDVCRTLQQFSEDYVLSYLKNARQSDNLCLSGGSALNGYINHKIKQLDIYKNIHIAPATGDCGLAVGVVLFIKNRDEIYRPKDVQYIGNSYNIDEYVNNFDNDIKREKIEYEKLYDIVADYIADGKIVGWYQGRSESGPRALGNRSILCDPRDPNMKDYLNDRVKHREWYRPFAPSILEEHVTDWFEGVEKDRFMLQIPKYKPGMGDKVPAVCHVDGTGRLQSVSKDDNEHYYNLINAFYNKTGIPIVLNTSFNDKEPIVDSPKNALDTFLGTNIDVLVLGDWLFTK